jgi:hypothetical protein
VVIGRFLCPVVIWRFLSPVTWRSAGLALGTTRLLFVQAPDLQDLNSEDLEPGEQPIQGRLVPDRAVHDGLDRFHRGGEQVEVEQCLGREDA